MKEFAKFSYNSLDEFKSDVLNMGFNFPIIKDLKVLSNPITVNKKNITNRLIVQPMEGCDSNKDGSPTDLVFRRYKRFAEGGAGLLWVEACAVNKNYRANPRQMWLTEENKEEFKKLVLHIKECSPTNPYLVLQLTHSGRYSKPGDGLPSIIAVKNPYLDKFLPENVHIVTDEEIEILENEYVKAAKLAKECGFDAVDVKACHRYLNSELLSAHTRDGKYGGSFENRTRFILNAVRKIKQQVDIDVTTRMNAYDEIPYPYGWGVSKEDYKTPDLTEPVKLVKLLYKEGVGFINLTAGNPYYNPHVNRPYDVGSYTPFVHPLNGVNKMLNAAATIKKAVPDMIVISTGYSWLREYGANVAAGCVADGWFDMVGFGRQSFAYPDFVNDILNGGMIRSKCCITCSKCTDIMRGGGTTGCPIKDTEVYLPIYKNASTKVPKPDLSVEKEHI